MDFLREYNKEQLARNEALVRDSIAGLPGMLAKPVKALVDKLGSHNYSATMNHCLDFLEISVQFTSCLLFARLQEAEKGMPQESRGMKAIVDKIDGKRSLSFGDWVNDIFNPVVKTATRELPDDALARSLAETLFRKGYNRLLGTKEEPGVVKIRNEYKGHSTSLSNEIYRSVTFTLEPHVLLVLEALKPLQGCSCSNSEHSFIVDGSEMFPLAFRSAEGYDYLFQSLRDEEIAYISPDENAVTVIDDRMNRYFDLFMQRSVPSFDIAKEMNWPEMRSLMREESARFLSRVYREKKYNRELFVDRDGLSQLFGDFIADETTLFPLPGEAGQGKTNQLCFWAEKLSRSEDAVLVFSSSDFAGEDLPEALRRIFGTSPRKDAAKIVAEVHKRAQEEGHKVYIFFDAINECLRYKGVAHADSDGPVCLYEAFRELFIRPEYPNFKLLFTCRSYSWKNLFQKQIKRDAPLMFGLDRDAEVHGFSHEELCKAWGIYQELYQMDGDFGSLSKSSLVRLKDPLILKIACTNHVGTALPENLDAYGSIALFRQMSEMIAHSYAGRQQYEIMLRMASYMLEEYEHGHPVDRIDREELRKARDNKEATLHGLSRLIFKQDGFSVAYTELLNKPERPILRFTQSPDGKTEIQFIYERFLEYLMAEVFVEKYRPESGGSIAPEVYLKALEKESGSVVYIGTLRNALLIDWKRTSNPETIVALMRDYPDNYELALLCGELMNVLIRENYEDGLFALIRRMLDEPLPDKDKLIAEFNDVISRIYANKADETVIARHKELNALLAPLLRLARNATVSVVGGMFLSDWYNSDLYRQDPYSLLWTLVRHPLSEVSNYACMYIYYLHNRSHTLEHTPLNGNVSAKIVGEMLANVQSHNLLRILVNPRLRSSAFAFVETGVRTAVMLIFDELRAGQPDSSAKVSSLMEQIRSLLSYLTFNFRLVKMVMPVLTSILRRQITFQAQYVNNAIEYQSFWDDAVVPAEPGPEGKWCRRYAAEVARYLDSGSFENFADVHPKLLKAYESGDSFSYFILERLMVVAGIRGWENIAPVVRTFFSESYRSTEWFDYSQMSMLYILYQVQKNSTKYNPELMEIYSREAADWTRRCKGGFKARNSAKANTTGLYKRDVMNWYADVYCTHTGDNVPHEGDATAVPTFYELIEEAIGTKNRKLLYHLIDNISELISDNGYIETALGLLLYIMELFADPALIAEFDAMECGEDEKDKQGLVQLIGSVLSTAKNYYPERVNNFLKRDISGLQFAGVSKYNDEVLNYNPGGETLSDLFTHNFGNFVIWGLVNFRPFQNFAQRIIARVPDHKDCFDWLDAVIRDGFDSLFDVKL